jgi:uncharacterized protein
MKLALLIVAILALVWLIRSAARSRKVRPPPGQTQAEAAQRTQPMLACAVCGVHMPRDEALPGRGGVFCSEAHRAAFEQAPPGP